MTATVAKKGAQRTWAIVILLLGTFVFFFGISIVVHLMGLAPIPQPPYYGLTRPWELTPRIPRTGIVLVAVGILLLFKSFFPANKT